VKKKDSTRQYFIPPGKGIDLDILKLYPEKPEEQDFLTEAVQIDLEWT